MLALTAPVTNPSNFLDRLESAVSRALDILIAAMSPDPAASPPREARLAASQVLRLASTFGLFRSNQPTSKPKADPYPAQRPPASPAPVLTAPALSPDRQPSSPGAPHDAPPRFQSLKPRHGLAPAAALIARAGAP
jgi:hypothetical protein